MKRIISGLSIIAILLVLTGCLSLKPFTQEELDRLNTHTAEYTVNILKY